MSKKDSEEINDIINTIMSGLKSEMENIKSEIKDDLKNEMDNIKSAFRDEIDNIRTHSHPSPEPPIPPFPPHPLDDQDIPNPSGNDNDDRESTTFDITDFSKIYISGNFEVEITQSGTFRVVVFANSDFFKNLDVSKEGNVLRVRHSRHIGWRAALTRPRVEISLPVLQELRLSGAVSTRITGFSSAESFRLEMSGASSVEGDMSAGNIDFDLSGACRTRLVGSARDAVLKVSGANRVDIHEFPVINAAVKLSGASRISANISGRLDARISGASYFGWRGEPVMGDIRTSGASRLNKE